MTLSGSVTDQQYCFTVPAGATFTGGKTHMRFRLTTDDLAQTQANAPWGGSATNGEVEDYYTPLYCVGNYLWTTAARANVQDAGDTRGGGWHDREPGMGRSRRRHRHGQ